MSYLALTIIGLCNSERYYTPHIVYTRGGSSFEGHLHSFDPGDGEAVLRMSDQRNKVCHLILMSEIIALSSVD